MEKCLARRKELQRMFTLRSFIKTLDIFSYDFPLNCIVAVLCAFVCISS